jgi:pimeloyl-ACP methyl ester carboxylesterase
MSTAIRSEQYWAHKGEIRLCLYRKYEAPSTGKPVLFLVHGSSMSALLPYDLHLDFRGSHCSVMDQCAMRGYDVWTMDHEGYGPSTKTENNLNVSQDTGDLGAAMSVIQERTHSSGVYFCGQSSGSLRAALFAEQNPQLVRRLVLDAFGWMGGDASMPKWRSQLDELRAHNVRKIDAQMIQNITRNEGMVSEREVVKTAANAQPANGDLIPTCAHLDMPINLPIVDPTKIRSPTLIILREDSVATLEELLAFFAKLPNSDKQFVMLSNCTHVPPFGLNTNRFYHAMFAFLDREQDQFTENPTLDFPPYARIP